MGGRTDPRSDKKFISINNRKKRAGRRVRKTGMVSGGWQFKAETSDMTRRFCRDDH